ncbi:hypothetical protein V1478_014353 [Vespula squamosa]|uniref:Uncharacterized protein n=1 Tax=Vespula squamosa TaxID=30214 RepID=A0ABD2A8N0_VESSQ
MEKAMKDPNESNNREFALEANDRATSSNRSFIYLVQDANSERLIIFAGIIRIQKYSERSWPFSFQFLATRHGLDRHPES